MLQIFISALEPSGDFLGARLMQALEHQIPGCRFMGVGGPLMQAEGLNSLFDYKELTLLGIFDIIPRMPLIFRRLKETAQKVLEARPQIVITIDSGGFHSRLAQKIRGAFKGKLEAQRPLLFHFSAPQVWAWRPKRAQKLALLYDHLLTLYPFEPPLFTCHGLETTHVGHPILEALQPFMRHKVLPSSGHKMGVTLLPGSRISEVRRHLPLFLEVAHGLQRAIHGGRVNKDIKEVEFFLPTVPAVAAEVSRYVAERGGGLKIHQLTSSFEKYEAFQKSGVALAASGTVTLELALMGTPTVLAYKLSWLNGLLARFMVRLPHVGLVNILLGERVVPEFLQDKCTVSSLTKSLLTLLKDPAKCALMQEKYQKVREHLEGESTDLLPSEQAAKVIVGRLGVKKF